MLRLFRIRSDGSIGCFMGIRDLGVVIEVRHLF